MHDLRCCSRMLRSLTCAGCMLMPPALESRPSAAKSTKESLHWDALSGCACMQRLGAWVCDLLVVHVHHECP